MVVLARGTTQGHGRSVDWLFTDRHGGVSESAYASLNLGLHVQDDPERVMANRSLVAAEFGCQDLAVMHQVHGRDVARIDALPATPPSVDALVTSTPGLALATQVADCVPILLADLEGGQVAAVHAGWRGMVAGVVLAALDDMAPRGQVHAWVGPAICPACYEVSAEVRDEAAAAVPDSYAVTRQGTPAIDLRAGVLAQLASRDVTAEAVGECTLESDRLYSFRGSARTGRQAGVIALRP